MTKQFFKQRTRELHPNANHLCAFLAQSIVATGGASSHPPDSAVSHTTWNFAYVGCGRRGSASRRIASTQSRIRLSGSVQASRWPGGEKKALGGDGYVT